MANQLQDTCVTRATRSGDYRSESTARSNDCSQPISMSCWLLRLFLIISLAVSAYSTQGLAQEQKLSVEECSRLVRLGLAMENQGWSIRLAKMDFSKYDRSFVYFYAYFETKMPNGASPRLGTFAVNPWTGQVFDAVSCQTIKTKRLEKAQLEIKKRMGIPESRYLQLKSMRPLC